MLLLANFVALEFRSFLCIKRTNTELSKNLAYIDTGLKIILMYHQDNYIECLYVMTILQKVTKF